MTTITEEETSNYSMSDFYSVLKWIPRSKVDRQEPVVVDDCEVVDGSLVLPTIYEEFNGIDEVQVFINFNGVHVNKDNIILSFSPLDDGELSLLSAKCTSREITYDTDTIIHFTLDKNVTFTDKTRVMTGVKSLKLDFNTNETGIIIKKIIMRCQNYTYTLSDIESFLITGEDHVLGKLGHYVNDNEIPKKLKSKVYMAAGAYAWLSRWEYETKPMKENKAEADNYATRLLNKVDAAISDYINDIENKLEHDDLFHATSTGLEWGL